MRRPGLGLGFELGVNFNAAADAAGGGSFSTSFSDISGGLFGTDTTQTGTTEKSSVVDRTLTESVDVDEAGILKMIDDILRGTSGLSEIFGAQGATGLFGGSVAKEGTEDLLAKISGEIAKVTARKTTAEKGTTSGVDKTTSESSSTGILDAIGL